MNTLTRAPHHPAHHAFPSGFDDLANALMKSGLVPFVLVDCGNVVAASPALRELLARTSPYHHVDGDSLASIVVEADRAGVAEFCASLLRNSARADHRCRLVHSNGSQVPVLLSGSAIMAGELPQIVIVVTDLSPWVGATSGAGSLHLPDAFDRATGFANGALLLDRMKIALASARRHRRRVAVLRVDLRNYDTLLASLAPEATDELETFVAETLRNCVRDCDTVARLGAREFLLLLSEIGQREDAGISAARVVEAVERLFERSEPDRRVSASIGVAVYPADGTNSDRLLEAALSALQSREDADGGFAFADATVAELAVIPPIEFRDEFDVGIDEIDTEHRELVSRTNTLALDLASGVAPRLLERDIRALVDSLRAHFVNEARHLGMSPYEGSVDVRTRNLRFLDELHCILLHVDRQSITLAVRHLHEWLAPHLRETECLHAA